jgi:hypothetical protein
LQFGFPAPPKELRGPQTGPVNHFHTSYDLATLRSKNEIGLDAVETIYTLDGMF